MTQTEARTEAQPVEQAGTFDSINPATGDVVGTHPVHGEAVPARAGDATA